jgi:WD40 repeat protein
MSQDDNQSDSCSLSFHDGKMSNYLSSDSGFKPAVLKPPDVSHQRFLLELRRTWDEADVSGDGFLNETEWMESGLRAFIREGDLSDEQFLQYFYRIDTNSTGIVTWDALVRYLIKEIASTQLGADNRAVHFVQKSGAIAAVRGIMHRDMVHTIAVCESTREYVTMSDDSIRFWDRYDLHLVRAITEPGMFAGFVIFDMIQKLIATTTSRRLMIFDLETLQKLPAEISASPSTSAIRSMNPAQAKEAISVLKAAKIPLANSPTTMCVGPPVDSHRFCCMLGDDQGELQVFDILAPARYKSVDYQLALYTRYIMHDGAITQLAQVPLLNCWASSSQDMTVKMWTFDRVAGGCFSVVRVFKDTEPILRFHVSESQKVLLTTGISRDAYVWSLSPVRRIFKLGGHYNQLVEVTNFELSGGQTYYVTLTNRKEFGIWDAVNYRLVREFSDPTLLVPHHWSSEMFFDERMHCLITASSVPARWAENEGLMGNLLEPSTHHLPIVGCHLARLFDQILTVDTLCNFKVWDCETGHLASFRRSEWSASSSQLTACTLDIGGRRLFTVAHDKTISIWNYNSGAALSAAALPAVNALISVLTYARIGGRNYLIQAGWDRTVWLFAEADPGEFMLYREYRGHTGDICSLALHGNGLVSGTVNGEVFGWALDTRTPQASFRIPHGCPVECLHTRDHMLFVGTGDGNLYVLLIPKLTVVRTIPGCQGISVPHSLSTIASDEIGHFLYTADTLGYVKKWKISTTHLGQLDPVGLTRIANDEITQILIIREGRFLIVAGTDMNVRIWHAETFQLVGALYEGREFSLSEPETWVSDNPFEPHPDHFVPVASPGIPLVRGASSLRGGRSSIMLLPPADMDDDEKVEEHKPFNIEDANRAIQDMMETLGKAQELPKLIKSEGPVRRLGDINTELPNSIRPMDLVAQIQGMWVRPRTASDPAKRPGKRPLRLPIRTPVAGTANGRRAQTWTRLLM